MPQKIRFHAFHILFRLFVYLAENSGGWLIFVRPKLLLGSLILGLGVNNSNQIKAQNTKPVIKSQPASKSDGIHNQTQEVEEDDMVFCYITEVIPVFPGGDAVLLQYLKENIKYPTEAAKNNIQGRVICQFWVNKDGSISEVHVVRSVHPLLDEEALRILKSMPNWTPGKQMNKTVRVKYTLPVNFKLPTK